VLNEGKYDTDLDKVEAAVKNATSFMGVGAELKKAGIKYDFSTSMIPMYRIKVSGNTIAIVNKKYAAGAERNVNDIAIGLLEGIIRGYGKSVNESDMDYRESKELLIDVVEALIIQVIKQASSKKINIPASDIESLRNTLKKEINSGKITYVGQIMKRILALHPKRESVNEAAFRTLFTHSIWKKRGVNYVDSNFVNDCKGKIPLSDLVHIGMGDFVLKTPHGNIEFDRVSEQFDGMSGRAHRMTGNKELMDMLFKKMKARVVHSESVNKSIKTRINEWSSNDVLALLGGKRFLATSGAYSMSGNVAEKTAKFHFKTPGKNGINNVWITETSPDKYTINFIKTDGEDVKVAPVKNISGDNLKSVFTKHTGLKTP
jgi:hypothetical protein